MSDVPLDASSINEGGLVVSLIVSLAFIAFGGSRYFEPADPRQALEIPKSQYLIRWVSAERVVYEGVASIAEVSEAGLNAKTFSSLEEANALARQLERQIPNVRYGVYAVTPGTAPVQLKDVSRVQRRRVLDPQDVWDNELTELAEEEASEMRGPVDEEWAAFRQRTLELGRTLKEQVDVEVIGGETGKPPCRLCNGKGVRVLFGEERPCDWCMGSGIGEVN